MTNLTLSRRIWSKTAEDTELAIALLDFRETIAAPDFNVRALGRSEVLNALREAGFREPPEQLHEACAAIFGFAVLDCWHGPDRGWICRQWSYVEFDKVLPQ